MAPVQIIYYNDKKQTKKTIQIQMEKGNTQGVDQWDQVWRDGSWCEVLHWYAYIHFNIMCLLLPEIAFMQ